MSELLEWIIGQGGRINLPNQLDLYLRANNSTQKPQGLYVPPVMIPTFIMNPSGYSPIIQWYDRNAIQVSAAYQSGPTGPHGGTVRWTYVVPAGRKCMMELIQAKIVRVTAVAGPVDAEIEIEYTPAGAAARNPMRAVLWTGVVGDQDSSQIGQSLVMFAGDMLRTITYDNNVGGTCDYQATYKGTEFDA